MRNGIGSKIGGWVAAIGILVIVNVLSHHFNWGFILY